jgi:superfamily II DNA helicase RecQ
MLPDLIGPIYFFPWLRGSLNQTLYIDDHRDKTGIIYAATRKGVESLYDYLHSKGYRVGKYHAGLSDTERTRNQEQFLFDEISLREIINLINLLIAEEYLKLTESKFPIVQLRKKVIPVLRNEERVTQRVPRWKQAIDADASLFGVLRVLRKQIAEREKVPPYIIFHDSTLREMCHSQPKDARSMLAIPGVGEIKFKKYGEQFLEAIRKYRNEQFPDA